MNRNFLVPLVPAYSAAATAKNLAYDRGLLKPKSLRWPVISIGNLSVGGAGKTPLVIRLAKVLKEHRIAVDVLSRGYGRLSTATEFVDPEGKAERYGDEPLLIARRTGVPVIVGASRYEAGRLAETIEPCRAAVHLLDDGFQHRKLARRIDVVVLHRTDFEERLIPAGRLREPLASLRRADFVVLREEDADLEAKLRLLGVTTPVWRVRRSIEPLRDAPRAIAFCGIARPNEFLTALRTAGATVLKTISFPDHHRYLRADIERLAAMALEHRPDAFLTTEKDEVRIDASMRAIFERIAPLRSAKLTVQLRDEEAIVDDLLFRLNVRTSGVGPQTSL